MTNKEIYDANPAFEKNETIQKGLYLIQIGESNEIGEWSGWCFYVIGCEIPIFPYEVRNWTAIKWEISENPSLNQ